jgi:hypothetical protein
MASLLPPKVISGQIDRDRGQPGPLLAGVYGVTPFQQLQENGLTDILGVRNGFYIAQSQPIDHVFMLLVQGVYIHEMSPPADLVLSIRRFTGGNCHIVSVLTKYPPVPDLSI